MTPPLKAARERVEADLAIFDNPDAIPSGGIVVVRCRDLRTILAALDEQDWREIAVGQQVVSSRGSLGVRNADDYFSPAPPVEVKGP